MRDARSSSAAGWAFALFAALTLASVWPLLQHFSSALPSDLGDPALNTWILWWNAHAVPLTQTWWNAPMFAPAPNAFALSESLLALTPLTTPLIRVGASPVAAYNVAFVLAGPLSALGAYLLAWRLTHRRGAALIAALAFGFSPYRIGQLPHLQMEWACWLPLALYFLHDFIDTDRRASLAAFSACWLITGLTNGYFLIYFPILLALWTMWFVRRRRHLISIAAAFVAGTLPLLPLLLAYRSRQRAFGLSRGIGEIQDFSADLTALWAASPRAWLASHWTQSPRIEGELYPGLVISALAITGAVLLVRSAHAQKLRASIGRTRMVLIVLAAVSAALGAAAIATGGWDLHLGAATWSVHKSSRFLTVAFWLALFAALSSARVKAAWQQRSLLTFYLLAAGAMLLMALGPDAYALGTMFIYKAPYAWLMQLPGGDSMRVPARFGELMMLCLSIAGALVWARLVKPGHRTLTLLIALAILCEGWIVMPIETVPPPLDIPAIAADATMIELPMTLGYASQTRALLHGISHGRVIANGFSGYDPPHFTALKYGLVGGDLNVITGLRSLAPLVAFVDRSSEAYHDVLTQMQHTADVTTIAETAQGTWLSWPRGTALSDTATDPELHGVTVTSATNAGDLGALSDGRIGTRWLTGKTQQPGMSLTLSFDHDATISAIELRQGIWVVNLPRELKITTADGTIAWQGKTAALAMMGALREPREVPIVIRFDQPVVSRTLKLELTATDPKFSWSVAELKVFGR